MKFWRWLASCPVGEIHLKGDEDYTGDEAAWTILKDDSDNITIKFFMEMEDDLVGG